MKWKITKKRLKENFYIYGSKIGNGRRELEAAREETLRTGRNEDFGELAAKETRGVRICSVLNVI